MEQLERIAQLGERAPEGLARRIPSGEHDLDGAQRVAERVDDQPVDAAARSRVLRRCGGVS